ncbi:MAG TPA: ribonuclease III [Prevotellaceae bacterium]|nr:ribonuclease III [Prevotellaceae bacterium]
MKSFWYMIKFFFHRKEELYLSLKQILGFYPHHIYYYKLALIHRSLGERDNKGKQVNNERLEYLGDAILEAVVSDILYKKYKNAYEGFLTTTRSKIVQRSTLNELSLKLGLNKLIQFTHYTESHHSCIGGNAFEALIGAIYLDQGYKRALWFIQRLIKKGYIKLDVTAKKEQNFKSALLEWGQKYKMDVRFETKEVQENNLSSEPTFYTQTIVEGKIIGKGKGYSKKESHQRAANKSMELLRHAPELRKALERRKLMRLVAVDMLHFLPQYEQLSQEMDD